jgi:hypothetical protein
MVILVSAAGAATFGQYHSLLMFPVDARAPARAERQHH